MDATHFREELDSKCWPTFERLLEDLGKRYKDWLVAIEPETQEYFLGQDDYDVLSRARKKHPQAVFFVYRLNEDSHVESLC